MYRHRARLLARAARTHLSLGEVEKAGRVAAEALAAASEADDKWAMGSALLVLAFVTSARGDMTEALPLFDRALTVTESDPTLTDLRLLLQLNKAVTLGNLDRHEEALTAARQARQLADQVGATFRLAQAHSALGQLLFQTGRWDDALAEVGALPEDLTEPGVACCVISASPPSSASTAATRARRAATWPRPTRTPSGSDAGLSGRWRWPAAWTASTTARCRRRSLR